MQKINIHIRYIIISHISAVLCDLNDLFLLEFTGLLVFNNVTKPLLFTVDSSHRVHTNLNCQRCHAVHHLSQLDLKILFAVLLNIFEICSVKVRNIIIARSWGVEECL